MGYYYKSGLNYGPWVNYNIQYFESYTMMTQLVVKLYYCLWTFVCTY